MNRFKICNMCGNNEEHDVRPPDRWRHHYPRLNQICKKCFKICYIKKKVIPNYKTVLDTDGCWVCGYNLIMEVLLRKVKPIKLCKICYTSAQSLGKLKQLYKRYYLDKPNDDEVVLESKKLMKIHINYETAIRKTKFLNKHQRNIQNQFRIINELSKTEDPE